MFVFHLFLSFSVANVPSFRACSTLVASLSGYQYTRKAWRKEMFELFFDANFFKIPLGCVGTWRIIIDNLLTQDQGSFRELMARATVTSTPTLNLFGNQETVSMSSFAYYIILLSIMLFYYPSCCLTIHHLILLSIMLSYYRLCYPTIHFSILPSIVQSYYPLCYLSYLTIHYVILQSIISYI